MNLPIRLSPTLPEETRHNGLAGNARRFVKDPDEPVLAVVALGTQRLTTDVETGGVVPTVRCREIELAPDEVIARDLRNLLERIRLRRLNAAELPYDEGGDQP